jgi:uncharacterized protein HemX
MTDSSGRTNAVRERAHSRLTVGLILAAVLIVGIGAFAVWRNSELASNNKVTQISTPAATASDGPSQVAASSAALSTVNELRETIAALQSTQKQILEEIASIKQKLASEQGERKLLTNQLGSLSVRMDELTAASASIAEGTSTGQSPKKRTKSR